MKRNFSLSSWRNWTGYKNKLWGGLALARGKQKHPIIGQEGGILFTTFFLLLKPLYLQNFAWISLLIRLLLLWGIWNLIAHSCTEPFWWGHDVFEHVILISPLWEISKLRHSVHAKSLQLCPAFAAPWSVANQASLSMGFSWQVYWSGLPFPTPGDLPNPASLMSSTLAGSLPLVPPGKPFVTASKINFLQSDTSLGQSWRCFM